MRQLAAGNLKQLLTAYSISKVSLDSFLVGESVIPKSDTAIDLGTLWDSELKGTRRGPNG